MSVVNSTLIALNALLSHVFSLLQPLKLSSSMADNAEDARSEQTKFQDKMLAYIS
jgi:hypothetical protein